MSALRAHIPASMMEWLTSLYRCLWTLYAFLSMAWTMLVLRLTHIRRQARLRRRAKGQYYRTQFEKHVNTTNKDNLVSPTVGGVYSCTRRIFEEARYCAVDEKIRRALAAQAKREEHVPRPYPVLAMIPSTPTAPHVHGSSLTAAAATALIDQVACCIGSEIFSLGPNVGEVQAGTRDVHHNVLLMMPNSAHYIPLWVGVAQSANVLNLLSSCTDEQGASALRRSQTGKNKEASPASNESAWASHSCSTTLLNTNISSNEMLCRSIEASNGNILIMDQSFARLLFPSMLSLSPNSVAPPPKGAKKAPKTTVLETPPPPLPVHLPPCIKKVFLWDSSKSHLGEHNNRLSETSRQATAALSPLTISHVDAILDFNDVNASPRRSFRGDSEMGSEAAHRTLLWARLWLSNITLFTKDVDERLESLRSPSLRPGDQQLVRRKAYSYPDEVLTQMGVELSADRLRDTSLCQSALASFSLTDVLVRIYTSGTTGLPKAARFTHARFYIGFSVSTVLRPRDSTREMLADMEAGFTEQPPQNVDAALRMLTVYCCLPMYHSAGGIFCTSHWLHMMEVQLAQPWIPGEGLESRPPSARLIMRTKFSASQFRHDIQRYRVTLVQYIGEILRYAVAAEQSVPRVQAEEGSRPRTQSNSSTSSSSSGITSSSSPPTPFTTPTALNGTSGWKAPIAMGNGLRPDQWAAAQSLLHLHRIVEFYASTEGNVAVFNWFGEPGAVGHLPLLPAPLTRFSPMYVWLFPMTFVEFDLDSELPKRHEGWCRVCNVGEPGELLGKIALDRKYVPDFLLLKRFDGYSGNKAETQKKILRNCFRQNDSYFRSGDLLRYDARGFVYFVDRVGDTFRWKGENVSTCEVAECLNHVDDGALTIKQSVVYGIAVPGREGRAGAAKITLQCYSPDRSQSSYGRPSIPAEEEFMEESLWPQLSRPSAASSLPSYAIPVFIRVSSIDLEEVIDTEHDRQDPIAAAMTTTFKFRKTELQAEGYQAALHRPPSDNEFVDRFYVLAPRNILFKTTPTKHHSPQQQQQSVFPSPAAREYAYVPLNAKTYPNVLGENFCNCGW